MRLSEIKEYLQTATTVTFRLPDGTYVPENFHVTEVGVIVKDFIDCGGTVRKERAVNFQLWNANDYEHRLKPEKLLKIIGLSEKVLGIDDSEIEVEYQDKHTIGKYGLSYDGSEFLLTNKLTACLAQDSCGVPAKKEKIALSELKSTVCCTPETGCC